MKYIGFDLGDGESAVAAFEKNSTIEPVILSICGRKSLLSAVGLKDGRIVIGDQACAEAMAESLSVRFKSRFTTGAVSDEDISRFVRGVLDELRKSGQISDDDRFSVGCPAGWNTACRARYKELLMKAGLPDPRVISESRAAFLYAKYARTVSLDVNILNESALVVDIGSSTLDFAYIVDGRETGVGTFGEIALGGGILDAALLRHALEQADDRKQIESVFWESKSWHSYCEIQARRLKEAYYTALGHEESPVREKELLICYDGIQRLQIRMDRQEAAALETQPLPELSGHSFSDALRGALENARRVTAARPPLLVLLTGGASRMPLIRQLCSEVFGNAVIITCPEPEFSIAKGLSYAGWVDENLQVFRQAVDEEMNEAHLEKIALEAMPALLPPLTEKLTEVIIEEVALPAVREWKSGEIRTLEEMGKRINETAEEVLSSPTAKEKLIPIINDWLDTLRKTLQPEIDMLCDRYRVPRHQMQLGLNTRASGKVNLKAENLTGLTSAGNVIGVILSLACGFLCGGSGVALVAAGPLGFLAGILIGAVVSLLGWKGLSDVLLKADLPMLLRHTGLENRLRSDATRQRIRQALSEAFSKDGGSWQKQIASGVASAFRDHVNEIARAAEIPIE